MTRSPASPHAWSKQQLQLHPELTHYERADPFARDCIDPGARRSNLQSRAGLASNCVWILVCMGSALTIEVLDQSISGRRMMGPIMLVGLLVAALGSPIAHGFGAYWVYRGTQRILRTELRRRGIPVCIRCGYQAGDIAAPRCPECGAPAP